MKPVEVEAAELGFHRLRDERPTNANSQARLDRRLDGALQETFPASDPVSVFITPTYLEVRSFQ